MKAIDRIGTKFGGWTVLGVEIPPNPNVTIFRCACRCGRVRRVVASNMYRGSSTQCKNCAARARKRNPEPLEAVADRYNVNRTEVGYGVKFLGWDKMIEWYERRAKLGA